MKKILLFGIVMIVFLPAINASLFDKLKVNISFNEISGTIAEDVINGYNITLVGNATLESDVSDCVMGSCMFMLMNNSAAQSINPDAWDLVVTDSNTSICMWLRSNETEFPLGEIFFFTSLAGGMTVGMRFRASEDGYLYYWLKTSDFAGNPFFLVMNDSSSLADFLDTKWHHVCAVISVNSSVVGETYEMNGSLYIDGSLTNTSSAFATVRADQNHGSAGFDYDGTFARDTYFVDEFLIWNKSLSASEVAELYELYKKNPLLDNCTNISVDMQVLNISVWNEEDVSEAITSKYDAEFFLYFNDTYIGNFSMSMNKTHVLPICISKNGTYQLDANIYNEVEGGFIQRWYLINVSVSNGSVKQVFIYNHLSGVSISDLNGVIKDLNYDILPNIYALLQRYYAGEGVYRTVQMDKSDEFGQIFFNVLEETTDYKITFQDYTTVLKTTEPMKFICESGICSLTFQVDPSVSVTVSEFYYNVSYDNETELVTLLFHDPTGVTNEVRLFVQKSTYGDFITICDDTVSASVGTIVCNTSDYTGNILVQVYTSASPWAATFTTWINKFTNALFDVLENINRNEGLVWSFGMALTITMMGLVSPVTVIITFILALVFIMVFQLTNIITMSVLISASVLGIVIAVRLKR